MAAICASQHRGYVLRLQPASVITVEAKACELLERAAEGPAVASSPPRRRVEIDQLARLFATLAGVSRLFFAASGFHFQERGDAEFDRGIDKRAADLVEQGRVESDHLAELLF